MLDILPPGSAANHNAPNHILLRDDSEMFELVPVSLWLEDFSGVRMLFDAWRADGVTDLRAHFAAHPELVAACAHSICIIKVNRRTLEQFEAADFDALLTASLGLCSTTTCSRRISKNSASYGTAKRSSRARP